MKLTWTKTVFVLWIVVCMLSLYLYSDNFNIKSTRATSLIDQTNTRNTTNATTIPTTNLTAPISTTHLTAPISTTHLTAPISTTHLTTPISTTRLTAPISTTHLTAPISTTHLTAPISTTRLTAPISTTRLIATTSTPDLTTTLTPTEKPEIKCAFPNLDPYDPAIKSYIQKLPPLQCHGKPSIAYIVNNSIKIDEQKLKDTVKSVDYCQYSLIKLSSQDDLHVQPLNWSQKFKNSIEIPNDLEHLIVQCLKKGAVVAETYKSRIFEKPEVEERSKKRYANHVRENSPAETMSVMFVGMDGMSKQNLIRGLPKTRDFIIKTMGAKELNMFNKVGDSTFPNVVTLLSGKNHTEFEERKDWNSKKEHFDVLDNLFIWNAYQKAGYRTAMMFDIIKGTAFHYLKKGWKRPPFDYYNRPGPLLMDKRSKRDSNDNCVGDQREVSLLLDYYTQLAAKFNNTKTKPYFAYSFFTHLSHDYMNHASKGDEMYLEFFTKLHEQKVLNNTVLVFFSDHGLRFGSMRQTFHGFIEGRSPYIFFIFPPWFEKKYNTEMSNFEINRNRLTTFYDIHATLKDILHFKGKKAKNSDKPIGTSLFREISTTRTCEDAHIPTEYCLCKGVAKEKVPKELGEKLAMLLLDMIIERTSKNRDICALLSLKSIQSVAGYSSRQANSEYYQVTLQTSPGGGYFEALLNYKKNSKSATLIGDIIRLNFYKGQDGCVNTLALKPYCYCKK